MKTIKINELELGDVVSLFDGGSYSHATICQITNNEIHFYRPYTHHDDFSTTAGLICYTGVERFSISRSDMLIELVEKWPFKIR